MSTALLADIAAQAPRVAGPRRAQHLPGWRHAQPVCAGCAGQLVRRACGKLLSIGADAEVTLEANPATVERGRFAEYRAAGINRVSLGAQSFDDETLKALGRIHQPADVLRAAEELHAAELANFNLDLMYALPEQSLAGALADVTSALALEPAHVSHYQLTLEPGTVFAARPPPLPDEDLAWAHADRMSGAAGGAWLRAVRSLGLRARGPQLSRTISTTGASATTWAPAPARMAR